MLPFGGDCSMFLATAETGVKATSKRAARVVRAGIEQVRSPNAAGSRGGRVSNRRILGLLGVAR